MSACVGVCVRVAVACLMLKNIKSSDADKTYIYFALKSFSKTVKFEKTSQKKTLEIAERRRKISKLYFELILAMVTIFRR